MISIPISVATGAMYGTGTTRRQERAKADAAKRKRDAGPDILNPQIRGLEAMDEALDTDHNAKYSTKGKRSLAHEPSIDAQTMPHLQQKENKLPFPNTTPSEPTLPELQTSVKTRRN